MAQELLIKIYMILIFLILFIIPSISYGEIYKWVDEKGVVHYTDDSTKIPLKYLRNIEKFEDLSNNDISNKSIKELRRKEDVHKDILGRGEEYWKKRVMELKNKLIKLQESVETLRLRYNELTEKYNESKNYIEKSNIRKERDAIKQEMDRLRSEIEEVKIELEEKIPEEARLFKAKEEWVK